VANAGHFVPEGKIAGNGIIASVNLALISMGRA
jgi:hypothetical protein